MTPNEIFALPTIKDQDWRDTDSEMIDGVFGISGFAHSFFDGRPPVEGSKILFSRKLSFYDGDEHTTNVTAVYFEGAPFMVVMTSGEYDTDNMECVVTDEAVFTAAKRHVAEALVVAPHGHDVVSGEKAQIKGHGGVVIAMSTEGAKLVSPYNVRWSDGALVFDPDAVHREFHRTMQADIPGMRENGLNAPELRRKAMAVLKAGVSDAFSVLDLDWMVTSDEELKWVPFAFADGMHTHMVVVDRRDFENGARWTHTATTRVGPPSVLHALESRTEGRSVDPYGPAVRKIEEMFGATSDEAVRSLEEWLDHPTESLCEKILEVIEAPVPLVSGEGPIEGARIHAYLVENPEAVAYCLDGTPTVKQAEEMMGRLQAWSAKNMAKSVPAP